MKLVLASGQEEWSALYIDSRLAYQAASMNFGQFMLLLKERQGLPYVIEAYQAFELNDKQQSQLDYHGMFPVRLVDLSKDEWFSDE